MVEEEQSIKEQIAAMEGWAIKARELVKSENFKEAIEQLRLVNVQGRNLEWRKGRSGLKHLPRLAEVSDLKDEITEARAAAQKAQDAANLLLKSKASESKIQKYTKIVTKQVTILIYLLQKAREIAEEEPWLDFRKVLSDKRGEKELFRGGSYYGKYVNHIQWRMIVEALKAGLVQEPRFISMDLSGVDFHGLNLKGAWFIGTNLRGANFTGADLQGAHFIENTDLTNATFENANLIFAVFHHATVDGMDLQGADVRMVIGLDATTMRQTKNWQKARNFRTLPGFL